MSAAAKVGDRLILKETGEVVVLDQVIRRVKEVENPLPRERIHVQAASPEMETWYKGHGLMSGSTIFRPAAAFEAQPNDEADESGAKFRI